MTETTDAVWTPVLDGDEVSEGHLCTVKLEQHQLVVGRSETDGLFALDNRCPHEGYPLASGDLKGGELTCCWHNWKFQVGSGKCSLGGEDVRAYPVRERDGKVEVDLAEPDPSEKIPALRQSLEDGMYRHDNGWALRAAVRLFAAGYPAEHLAEDVAAWDARVAEYGTNHALAVAADGLRIAQRFEGSDALFALAPAIDMAGEANRRRPERVLAPPIAVDPGAAEAAEATGATGAALRLAVEAEDAARAEGLLVGALDAGVPRDVVEEWLYAAISDHFLDFGHALIYLVKAQELLAATGGRRAREILAALLYRVVLGTREDTLPYMVGFRERLLAVEDDLERVWRAADGSTELDPDPFIAAVLHGKPEAAFDALWSALERGASPDAVARTLVVAASERFLAFDDAIDRDPSVTDNWLFVTHRFTFASAVRNAVERFRRPDALRFLVQLVAFLNTGKALDLPDAERPGADVEAANVDDVVRAIAERDAWGAVRRARAVLAGGEVEALRVRLEDLCLSDPLVRPIVVTHAIKTTVAAFEEAAVLRAEGVAGSELPILAVVRLLASPIVERRVHQAVRTSIDWVEHGRMPRKLTQ